MESFWARTGFTPDLLPTRYLNRAEFACSATKPDCSLGVTAMRSLTVTAGPERVLTTAMVPTPRAPSNSSAMPALIFQFIVSASVVILTQVQQLRTAALHFQLWHACPL